MPVCQITSDTHDLIMGAPDWTKREDGKFELSNNLHVEKAKTDDGLKVWLKHFAEIGRPAAIVKHNGVYTVWVAGTRCQIEEDSTGKRKAKYAVEGDEFKGDIVCQCHDFAAHI